MEENNNTPASVESKGSMVWVILAIIIVVGALAFVMLRKGDTETADTDDIESSQNNPSPAPEPAATPATSPVSSTTPPSSMREVKTFTVEGNNFSFSPKEIRVNKGDTVKITFNNKIGFHDWVIDEFNAKTSQIGACKSETIQFVADKTGTFEYYCSVGQHRANGMWGKLIVE